MGNRGAPESALEGAPGNRGAPESALEGALPVQVYQEEHPREHFLEHPISRSTLESTFRSTPISHSTLGSTFQSTSREFPFSTPVAGGPDCNSRTFRISRQWSLPTRAQ